MWYTIKWRPVLSFSSKSFHNLFSYGWKVLVTNFITTLFVNIRGLIIGKFYSPVSLAYFDRGQQMPNLLMSNIVSTIQSILFPVFSSEQDNKEHVKYMVRRSIKTTCLFIFPILIGLLVASENFVIVFYTEKWISIVPFIRIFCIAQILMPIQIVNIQAIMSLGYSNIILKLEIIKKIIEISILVVSMYWGVMAIAAGMVLYNFISLFINLYPNKKLLNYGAFEQVADVMPSLLIAIIMGGGIYSLNLLQMQPLILLITQIIVGIVIYFTICYLFRIESFFYILKMLK